MTYEDIATMIGSIGLPFAYDHFNDEDEDKPTGPPFICFLYPNPGGFMADNINYVPREQLVIELYTDNIDITLEADVETALASAELPFTKAREYVEDERMYQTTYTTEVYLDG